MHEQVVVVGQGELGTVRHQGVDPPGEWLATERVEEARRLLEATALPVEEMARLAGFGSAANLRLHFGRAAGLSPRDYRDRFGHAACRRAQGFVNNA